MKRFAFNLFMLVVIAALCYGGYYCLKSLTDPKKYVVDNDETLGDLHQVDSQAIGEDDTSTADSTASASATTSATAAATSSTSTAASSTSSGSSSSATLSAALQALATNKTLLKQGSTGTAVGSIEQFMNLYFQTSAKIDNDFGKTLTTQVTKFQTQNKVSATGQVGPQTLQEMILWLSNNS